MRCGFRIAAWQAVSDRMQSAEQWQQWAQGGLDAAALPPFKPDVAFLPAMQRRRLSLTARLLFQAAHGVLGETEPCAAVAVSHDGEINRSFALWLDWLRGNGVSPTSFGLSVHNATVGQWSMLRGDMSENTALSAACGGLEAAVAEAAGMLADGMRRVLVVAADEPLADGYTVAPVQRAPFAYAVALLLEAGDDWHLEYTAADTAADYWGTLAWVRHYLNSSRTWQDGAWRWIRNL